MALAPAGAEARRPGSVESTGGYVDGSSPSLWVAACTNWLDTAPSAAAAVAATPAVPVNVVTPQRS